ncbi:MAG TPA: hypothetical protein VGL03_04860 [Thermoanaerobaculia bacterium]|jgi:hypothetical protein
MTAAALPVLKIRPAEIGLRHDEKRRRPFDEAAVPDFEFFVRILEPKAGGIFP